MSAIISAPDVTAREAGLKLAADLLDAAKTHMVDGQLFASTRGRDTAHCAFAADYLQRACQDDDVYAGFAVAISAYLAAVAAGHQLTAEDLRQASWDEVHGGPATVYWSEVTPSPQPKEPPVASGGASEPPPSEPLAGDSSVPSWRAVVADLVDQVERLMGAAAHMDLDSSQNGAFARGLLYEAQQIFDRHAAILHTGDPDDYYGECIMPVQYRIVGARHMPETATGMDTVLDLAVGHLERISRVLDDASTAPPAPPLPITAVDQLVADAFMSGKDLCCELVEEAIRIEQSGSDESELSAAWRGRGVPQNNFARRFLTKVIEEPELLEGFSAALSCTLRCAGTANDNPGSMRAVTFEDFVGGPDTKYTSEEGLEEPAPAEPEVTFTNPIEVGMDAILSRIDMFLEGLEHVGIGDAAYTALHQEACPHFWTARELLDRHASSGAVMHPMRQLRDGLNKVAEVMGEDNAGRPLVDACLKPLNILFRRSFDDVEITADRSGVVTAAGRFISRMVGVLRTSAGEVQQRDWSALHEAASVIMSMEDPVEDTASLQSRLEVAIASASVIFEQQPPKHWREEKIVRQDDVGKRIVASSELVAA